MGYFDNIAANAGIEPKLGYEGCVPEGQTRVVAKVVEAAEGGFYVEWADEGGVLHRHTTSRKQPPTGIKPKMVVAGGWDPEGTGAYHLLDVKAKQWLC